MTLPRPAFTALRLMAVAFLLAATGLSGQTDEDAVRPFWGIASPGGRANGLAQAFTGVADDATALTFNPAGLANLTRGELNISLGHLNATTEIIDPAYPSSTSIRATRLGNLSLVLPLLGTRFTWAATYQQVRAYDRRRVMSFEPDSLIQYRRTETITEEGTMGTFSVGIAYQVSPQLALGGSIDLLTGENDYKENITFPTQPDLDDYTIIKPDYSGFNIGLGLMLAPIPQWRLGLLLRTPQKINIKELYTDVTLDNWETYNYSARSSYYLRGGTSLTMGPWLVAADIYWFDYSQIKFESNLYDGEIPIDLEINQTLRSSYKSVTGWALGGELLLFNYNVKLRGGYRLDPAFYRSSGNSANQQTIALGFSVVPVPALKFDFTITNTTWKSSLYEKFSATNLALGLIYRL